MDHEFESNENSQKPKKSKKSGGFQSMGFSWQILKSIINGGYKLPTPIQRKAIPEVLLCKDVVAMARTGSGKTAAFLLPMLQRLQEKENNSSKKSGPRALVMSPTRELALQTFRFTKQFAKYTNFTAAVILGGDKIEDQFETMHENPDIIIATPGRFLHICIEMNLKLNSIEYVCFDEADRLFEMGFKEQLNEILHKLPTENRQTLLFSATLPQSLVEFARAGLQNPVLIRLDVDTKLSDKLKMAFFQCRVEDKLSILIYLLKYVIKSVKNPSEEQQNDPSSSIPNFVNTKALEQTLIFVATKHHVEFLRELLENMGYLVSYAYSSLDQTARQINIAKFQNKKTSIMIVTDVAARGIDIPMLNNVINFNFPAKAKLFQHRVGRVARAGQTGNSFSLVSNDEIPYMHELHEFLSRQIKFAEDNMKPEEWQDVYGSVPQAIIEIERDTIKTLLDSKVELASAFQVQENAYKQYLKSRPLANSTSVKAAKNVRILHPVLPIHPLLRHNNELNVSFELQSNILDKLKNYSTKTTIFEINKTSASQPSAQIMKNKRVHHDRVVERYKSKEPCEENISLFQKNMYTIQNGFFKDENNKRELFNGAVEYNDEDDEDDDDDLEGDKNVEIKSFDDQDIVIKITNNDEMDNKKVNAKGSKRGSNGLSKKAAKRKNLQIIDVEHFIPYKPKNADQEKALGINTNFNREISNATMDLVADDETENRKNLQKTKWDRKKKKFVSVQSTLDKSKKFKTESGSYINASYKSDMYAKWLKKNKTYDNEKNNDDSGDEQNEAKNKKNKKFFGSSSEKKFFGSHKFKSSGRPGVKRFSQKENGDRDVKTRRGGKQDQQAGNFRKGKFTNQNKSTEKFDSNGKSSSASFGSGSKNKRFNVGLKNKDQIMKERTRKARVQKFQKRGKKGGSNKARSGKKSFK